MKKLGTIFKLKDILPSNFDPEVTIFKLIDKDYINWISDYPAPFYSIDFIKYRIIQNLPTATFPEEFYFEVNELKKLLESWNFLSRRINEEIIIEEYGFKKKVQPTLYDIITRFERFPAHKYISQKTIDLRKEIENCYKLSRLARFFINKGRVFDSNLSVSNNGKIQQYKSSFLDCYDLLEQDGILRKANENEIHLILNFMTKKEILIAIDKTKKYKIEQFSRLMKKEIIKVIKDDPEIREIKLFENFYLLNDNYQELKNWLRKVQDYYGVYYLLQEESDISALLGIEPIMKDLITQHKDYHTAKKLGDIFYKIVANQNKGDPIINWEIHKIEIQMKKVNKYFRNNIE